MTPAERAACRNRAADPPSARFAILLALLVLLAAMGGCTAGAEQDPPARAPAAQAAAPFDEPVVCPQPTLSVSTGEQLGAALAHAGPGTVIGVADGTYDGDFAATTSGTAAAPIWLCGSTNAVLRGRGTDAGSVLHLQQLAYWRLIGFTVRQGEKGVLADGVTASILQDLTVTDIGDEAVHLRASSTGNVVRGLTISRTGLSTQKFGEGVYVGTAVSNWCEISGCGPDRSDGNVIDGNVFTDTTAESIDIKEGTTGGVITNNQFDGSGMQGDADSWVNVKGNGWIVRGNRGRFAKGSGFQVHQVADGWGIGNVFDGNTADVRGTGYGFELRPIADNQVTCTNTALQAARGLTNTTCG